jgi:ubiquinone/menaquinone biosynthesis C-methylase UbiE/transcriptional regulator with XRE-family HTH domain
LATATGLSEAQLFRYINGDCDIAVSKLQALATAAQVAPEWLLTGTPIIAPSARPEFQPELLRQVTQTVEEYLFEYPINFSPKHRADLIALAYESLRHDIATHDSRPDFSREGVFELLDFAAALKKGEELETYHDLLTKLDIGHEQLSVQDQHTLARLARIGWEGVYNGISGQMYFDRVGQTVSAGVLQGMLEVVAQVMRTKPQTPPDWLDLGCGNGRHLLALSQHSPHLRLHGVDSSNVAAGMMRSNIQSGRLPEGCFTQGSLYDIPHAPNSFDVVQMLSVLNMAPLVAEAGVGANRVMEEVHRILRPNGLLYLVASSGAGRQWSPFFQYFDGTQMSALLERHGFELISGEDKNRLQYQPHVGTHTQDYVPPYARSYHTLLARKKA